MKYENPQIESSFRENNLGKTLYDLVMKLKPKKIVEFGTLNGYSAVCMAMALHELDKKKKHGGHIYSYDLWDSYKFKHAEISTVTETIKDLGLDKYITLAKGSLEHWTPSDEDLVFVDISNSGETITMLREKMKHSRAVVLFEGGIPERDRVQWMSKYNKQTFGSCGVRYQVIDDRFPGLSELI